MQGTAISPFWKGRDILSGVEAAALIAGIDPNHVVLNAQYFYNLETGSSYSAGYGEFLAAFKAIKTAQETGRLTNAVPLDVEWDERPSDFEVFNAMLFERSEVLQWLVLSGVPWGFFSYLDSRANAVQVEHVDSALPSQLSAFESENVALRARVAELESELRKAKSDADTGKRWPWGDHHTELLGHLSAAATSFWKLYDPEDHSTAPINKNVVEWLVTKRKTSKNAAEVMATILRSDSLPSGPRK